VLEIIHRVDLILKELLPQDKDSKRLAKIHLEVVFLMFVLDTNIKLITSLKLGVKQRSDFKIGKRPKGVTFRISHRNVWLFLRNQGRMEIGLPASGVNHNINLAEF
jgi:hypothetical protein